MAKKSFKDNPALQFISTAAPDAQQAVHTDNTDYTDDAHTQHVYNTHNMYTPAPVPSNAPERKTKRLNLLIRPSLMADIAKIAHMRRLSVNDLINTALAEYGQAHRGEVEDYDRVFGGG